MAQHEGAAGENIPVGAAIEGARKVIEHFFEVESNFLQDAKGFYGKWPDIGFDGWLKNAPWPDEEEEDYYLNTPLLQRITDGLRPSPNGSFRKRAATRKAVAESILQASPRIWRVAHTNGVETTPWDAFLRMLRFESPFDDQAKPSVLDFLTAVESLSQADHGGLEGVTEPDKPPADNGQKNGQQKKNLPNNDWVMKAAKYVRDNAASSQSLKALVVHFAAENGQNATNLYDQLRKPERYRHLLDGTRFERTAADS